MGHMSARNVEHIMRSRQGYLLLLVPNRLCFGFSRGANIGNATSDQSPARNVVATHVMDAKRNSDVGASKKMSLAV